MIKKKYTTAVIDRNMWCRGGQGKSMLLRSSDHKMCCLGFASLASGLAPENIMDKYYPACIQKSIRGLATKKRNIVSQTPSFQGLNQYANTLFARSAAEINDDYRIDDSVREDRLQKLAKQNGFIFKFIN